MSPRAACRLESLGFDAVYDYTGGKLDWLAAGLPTEGSGSSHPRAAGVARADVPTCALDERLGDVAGRVREAGWDTCVVVSADRCVLGLLRARELDGDPEATVEDAMRPGPSTFRPHTPVAQLVSLMREHDLANLPVTSADGRLIGVLLREDAERALEEHHGGE